MAFSQSVSPEQQKQSSDTPPAEPKVLDLSLNSIGPTNSASATIPSIPMRETRSDKQSHIRKRNKWLVQRSTSLFLDIDIGSG